MVRGNVVMLEVDAWVDVWSMLVMKMVVVRKVGRRDNEKGCGGVATNGGGNDYIVYRC